MRASSPHPQILLGTGLALCLFACGTSGGDGASTSASGSTSDTTSGTTSPADTTSTVSGSSGGTTSGSTSGTTVGTTGTPSGAGGATSGSVTSDGAVGGSTDGGLGGSSTDSGATSTTGAGGGCSVGSWPAVDPAEQGPYSVVTENDVGPVTAESDEGEPLAYTMFRPEQLGEAGLCHPVVTWGNGTGANPGLYGVFLRHLASHGFVVIASDSPNVGSGDPQPMVAGVDWVIEQNADPSSVLYQQIDVTHIGATGHSQGGFATTQAGGDDNITTIAPLCGAAGVRNLHGPAMLFCGGQDDVVACSGIENTFEGISGQPAMFANYLTADHANWITFNGTNLSPVEVAVVAWMRVHLMADDALRSWFYGASCGLCTDSAWEIRQSMMDE